MDKLTLTITLGQAAALTRLLDLASRMHIGQFREIENLARSGEIKHMTGGPLSGKELEALEYFLGEISRVFGFTSSSNFGIHSQHVSKDARRGYEIKKVIEKALAEHRDPNPGFRGVDYDGIIVRLTDDPVPVAVVK